MIKRKRRAMNYMRSYFYRVYKEYKFDLEQSARPTAKLLLTSIEVFNWKVANDFC